MIDYDPHDWKMNFFSVRGSMLTSIAYRVISCMLVAVVVCVINRYAHTFHVSNMAHALIGTALGLLLVFRTNSSYDRFWEGRKLWGGLVNTTRNLTRATGALFGTQSDAHDTFEEIRRLAAAFPYACMHTLRHTPIAFPASLTLSEALVARVMGTVHVPTAIAGQMSVRLQTLKQRGVISDIQQMGLEQDVGKLVDYIGACERIHKTPLPFAYVVHLRRALVIYCATLPIAIVETFGWWTILVTLLLSYTLFGIEEIGVEIEDPFGLDANDLPLEAICQNIERNVMGYEP